MTSRPPGASSGESAVIPIGYLNHLKSKVGDVPLENERSRKREELHELSKARAMNWPNTLQANRSSKEQRLLQKREAEEAKRVEQDREEERIAVEKRTATLARAQKLIYENSDRVKTFHGSLLMSEVLKERESQVEFKKGVEEQKRALAKEEYVQQLAELKLAEQTQARKDQQTKLKARALAAVQQEQLAASQARYAQQVQQEMEEGELIRRKAAEDIELEKEEHRQRVARAREAVIASKQANDYLKQLRVSEKERSKDEAARLREYQTQKDELERMKKQRMDERFKAKLAIRQRMIDDQARRLADVYAANHARLEQQVKELAEKEAFQEQAKADKRATLQAAVHRSRQHQLEQKRLKEEKKRHDEEEYKVQWRLQNQMMQEEERQEKLDGYMLRKQLSEFHQQQQAALRAEQVAGRQYELLEAQQLALRQGEDEERFQKYAQGVINEFALEGKPIKPIQIAMRKFA